MKFLSVFTVLFLSVLLSAQSGLSSESDPAYPLDIQIPLNQDFPLGVVTDYTVKVKNTSLNKVGYGIKFVLATSSKAIEVTQSEYQLHSVESGAEVEIKFQFKTLATGDDNMVTVPLAIVAFLTDNTLVGSANSSPVYRIAEFYRLGLEESSEVKSDKEVMYFELEITNTFRAYRSRNLQLDMKIVGEDGQVFEIIGPSQRFIAPIAKRHTKEIILPVKADYKLKSASYKKMLLIKIYENGLLVTDRQVQFD